MKRFAVILLASAFIANCGEETTNTLPSVPLDLIATASLCSNEITLAWTDDSQFESGYRIKRRDDTLNANGVANDFFTIATIAANSEIYVDDTAATGTTYTYIVASVNLRGENESVQSSATAGPLDPPDPSCL